MTSEYKHTPVMLNEVIELMDIRPDSIVCDCTLGGAGHSSHILEQLGSGGLLIGIDQDDDALHTAQTKLSACTTEAEFVVCKSNFSQLDHSLQSIEVPGVDAFLFDLGVSSPQLDWGERGFSFHEDARLDMRMDPSTQTLDALEVIHTYTAADLTRILSQYGEEPFAAQIAKAIVRRRESSPIETTFDLVECIKSALPEKVKRKQGHPARKSFQAIRIEVNRELEVLAQGLDAAIRWLKPGGVVCVISYHSLEDRVVKQEFARYKNPCECPPDFPMCVCGKRPLLDVLTPKPRVPQDFEIAQNPRARSAKVRAARKLACS